MAQTEVINELLSLTSKDTLMSHSQEYEDNVEAICVYDRVDCSKTVHAVVQFHSRADSQNHVAETAIHIVFRHFATHNLFHERIEPVRRDQSVRRGCVIRLS